MGNTSSREKMDQTLRAPFFLAEDVERLQSSYNSGGLEAIMPLIQEKINALNNTELHIAVTGESGTGKSTFINAMRGLKNTDEGAAEIGNVETTMKPTKYQHPSFPEVYFWDLPGVGTVKYPAKKYLSEMNFQKYDFFILLSGDRFKEHDTILAKEINLLEKKLYFVRSKIENSFHVQSGIVDKETELEKIRDNSVYNLEKAGISQPAVFLVSSYQTREYDFPTLNETLANNLNDIKKDVFVKSLPNTTVKVLAQKRDQLKKRIWMLATLSGGVGAVPVPGLSFACDLGILVTGIIEFRTYLGLDDASLQRLANITGKPVEFLKAEVKTPLMGEINKEFIKRIVVGSTFVGISVAEVVLNFVPVIGSIFGATSSFALTYSLLNKVLDELTENAQRMVTAAFATS
ncbi:interferon-inducible GTPase 5-like isoform X2 [Narcine bancroftii]|uniref:interferon-inducible GTPase 5-like isoform X2 n=1 Tax=Narcine bancroftii TaxID=1343680 RepID=UPI003831DFC1